MSEEPDSKMDFSGSIDELANLRWKRGTESFEQMTMRSLRAFYVGIQSLHKRMEALEKRIENSEPDR